MIPLENIKKDMRIRLANDVTYSIDMLGGGEMMRKMQGGIYVVEKLSERSVRINGGSYGHWWFMPEDLNHPLTDEELAEKLKKNHPSVMFDPANL